MCIFISDQKEWFFFSKVPPLQDNFIPYVNTRSISLGHAIIKNFDPLYIYNKYKVQQQLICKELNVIESICVFFGIDNQNLFEEYNRGGKTNRLCFSKLWDNRNG